MSYRPSSIIGIVLGPVPDAKVTPNTGCPYRQLRNECTSAVRKAKSEDCLNLVTTSYSIVDHSKAFEKALVDHLLLFFKALNWILYF